MEAQLEEYVVDCIVKDLPLKDKFDFKFVKVTWPLHDGVTKETQHYPYSTTATNEDLDYKIRQGRKAYISTLHQKMLDYVNMNPNKVGTVFFSPANKFSTVNTEGKSLYAFGWCSGVDIELTFESNFIIL